MVGDKQWWWNVGDEVDCTNPLA